MNRSNFIRACAQSSVGVGVLPFMAFSSPDDPSPINTKIVREFVSAGHNDLIKTQEMLADYPNLLYSRYDWGNGDFEEAIEGAGHLGNKEIANYLIDQGARVNLFVLTMLGKTELVKPVIESYPNLLNAYGAHGFTLLHHAKVGQCEALEEYLIVKGLTETKVKIQ